MHRSHGKDNAVKTRNVSNRQLENGDENNRQQNKLVILEHTRMHRVLVRESSTEGDEACTESQSVGSLRVDTVNTFMTVDVVIVRFTAHNVFGPEGSKDSNENQDDGTKSNAEEKESTDETLSDTTRRNIHDSLLGRLDSSNKSERDSADQVTVKHLDSCKNNLVVLGRSAVESEEDTEQNRKTLGVVDRGVDHENLSEVIPNNTTFTDGTKNGGKVIISQNHFSGFTSDISTLFTHSNTHIGGLEGRGIIDTISSHTGNFSLRLQGLDNSNLVLRRGTSKDVVGHNGLLDFLIIHGIEFRSGNSSRVLSVDESKRSTNSKSGILVISSDHGNTDSSMVGFFDGDNTLGTRRIDNGTKTNDSEPWVAVTDKFRLQ
mmetsp:Transcript_3618/g.7525  ORF Transcript_3618/g.7525 Transcript_3618/m.7525 type:complete len:375 (-) Transcript_3618:1869-2993(-)